MRFVVHPIVWTALAAVATLPGCQLATTPNPLTLTHKADHVVINEVFTLPADYFGRYSWIELYNPTDHPIPFNWSLTYHERLTVRGVDTSFLFTSHLTGETLDGRTALRPGEFLIVAGDSARYIDHTDGGPAGILYVESFPNPPMVLNETDEIGLYDSSGALIDLVRFGNFVPPSPDPFPANHSAGMIPMWYSLARYAGAYSTGNTADDFYMEPKPVPGWYNQRVHP